MSDYAGIQRGALETVFEALKDFANNKIPLADRETCYQAKRAIGEAVSAREELRKEIVQQYKPEDAGDDWKGFADVEDAPEELLTEIQELQSETVDLDLGHVTLTDAHDELQFEDDDHYSILRQVGFLRIEEDTQPDP